MIILVCYHGPVLSGIVIDTMKTLSVSDYYAWSYSQI